MIKNLLILILFSNFLFAEIVLENSSFNKVYLEQYTKVFIDESSNLSFEDIKNKEFKFTSKFNYTATKSAVWSSFSIKSLENIEVYFENIKAGVDLIDVYIVKDGNLLKKIELGDYRDIKNREIKTRNSAFVLNLEKNSTYDFFIKHNSYSGISVIWEIYNKSTYDQLLSFRSLVWGIFIGTIFVLAFHNIFIYLSIKEKAFLFYVMFIISSSIYQLLVNGIFYEYIRDIDLNILNGLNWIFAYLLLLSTLCFHLFVLKPKKNSLSFKLIIFSMLITIITLIYYSFSFKYPDIRYSVIYTNYVSYFSIFVLLFTSFLAYKNGQKGARTYFIVLIIYIILLFYVVYILIGNFEYFENFWLFIPTITLIDISLFTIILYSKLKDIERQRNDQVHFIISQARFTSLGNNVANMIHQWKNPIAQIGSQVTLLEATYNLDNKNYIKTSKEIIPHIKSSILFLKDTMNDIYNFYRNPSEKENFFIQEQIDTLLRILKNELETNNIKVNLDIENIEIYSYKTSFLNIIMILLENAIFQLKYFKEKDRRIVIIAEKLSDNTVRILIEDNGGGIPKEHLNSIFDLNFSTKNKSGSGIGLALAKTLVETRLNAQIEVINSTKGAIFTITLNK
ncbi:sensor histidine kinase [Aliarcobacter lanthieri]|uniref:sensor histidine kinase n=1 Tax=Aliarcobacter lanthieri TaxID=1355374 RepID=UPI001A926F9F|nr:sensor histidine kinase [Aliarcobacter lanthieri]